MLHEAMGSVYGQTFHDHQLLVSCSEHWWPSKINELVDIAQGEIVCVLPDDDLLAPTFLSQTVEQINKGYDLCYTNYARQKRDGSLWDWPAHPWAFESFRDPHCNPMNGLTWAIRKDAWKEVGGLDETLLYADWGFLYEAWRRNITAAWVQTPLVVYREHDHQSKTDSAVAIQQLRTKYPELATQQRAA